MYIVQQQIKIHNKINQKERRKERKRKMLQRTIGVIEHSRPHQQTNQQDLKGICSNSLPRSPLTTVFNADSETAISLKRMISQIMLGQNNNAGLFSKLEERARWRRMLEKELEYDHASNLPIMNSQNQACFQPAERVGPYRENMRKTMEELKELLAVPNGVARLSNNKYTADQLMAIFHSTKDYDNEENIISLSALYVEWTRMSRLIYFLEFKRFDQLRILNIGGNFVESVENLCRVEMPKLEQVYLFSNNLTCLRSLGRNNWPNLRVLDFHLNHIVETPSLRYLANDKIDRIVYDSNQVVSIDEGVVFCSRSPRSRISASFNQLLKWVGRPAYRMKKRAIEVNPCIMKVRYI